MEERPGKILVVDDERHIARFLEFILQREGYEVQVAHDGSAALKAISLFCPDAVFLDLVLPDISGLEILRTIRADRNLDNLKILVLTAKSSDDVSDEVRNAGANAFATKPIAPSAVLRRLLDLGLPSRVPAVSDHRETKR